MTHLTGDAVRPTAFGASLRRDTPAAGTTLPGMAGTAGTAGAAAAPVKLTGAELRASLAALPVSNLRRGYRTEAVDRMVERVAEELDRRAAGEKPFLRAEHVHPDGVAMSRPGYAVAPARALLAAAADALKIGRARR